MIELLYYMMESTVDSFYKNKHYIYIYANLFLISPVICALDLNASYVKTINYVIKITVTCGNKVRNLHMTKISMWENKKMSISLYM